MMITRVSKGREHEIYNKFVNSPQEIIRWSDDRNFLPDPQYTFKKESIKDDFFV